jgi:hypothetical protein
MSTVEIQEEVAITGVDADAVLALLDHETGEEKSGVIKLFPDISQLIDMMTMKKELIPGRMFWIALDSKYMICIVRGTPERGEPDVAELLRVLESLEIKSINIPNDAAFIGLLMQNKNLTEESSILFRACGQKI